MTWTRSLRRLAVAGGVAVAGYALQRRGAQRWHSDEAAIVAAGLTLPTDIVHHQIAVSDGGVIHCVERGSGTPIVFVHGVTLDVGIWAHQFRQLGANHRVIAITQRGHGESTAGDSGYSLDRLAADLGQVLVHLELTNAIVVGHSMGGMVTQLLALRQPEVLARHAAGIVLVATTAGPTLSGPAALGAIDSLVAVAGYGLRHSARQGRGLLPYRDLGTWIMRAQFGTNPSPAAMELVRLITARMSPAAMAELIPGLLSYDIRDELGKIELPTRIVVGTKDRLTPLRAARTMAAGIPDSTLEVYDGVGHLVMLERSAALEELIETFAGELSARSNRSRRLLRRGQK
jgi:non-heme chloroperoxidase